MTGTGGRAPAPRTTAGEPVAESVPAGQRGATPERGLPPDPGAGSRAAADSVTVATWTVVSRVTGLVRIAAIGAVLGPTVLGNTFQFTNALPNLIYYGLLAGSLFTSLLVPALVHHVDERDRGASERLAGGFLGTTLLALAVVLPVAVLLAPTLLAVTAPDHQAGAGGADQAQMARLLFLMFAPQVFCYAVVGTASATMNAHQRFGLAAAAPALENVGIIVVLGIDAAVRGRHPSPTGGTGTGELLLLGLGTTAAVAAHAALQWWGARRAGVVLRPLAGWRNPEVTTIIRRAMPSLGQAGLLAVQVIILLAAANRTTGGVVGFQLALSFVYLAVALGVTPVALGMLPWLSRLFVRHEVEEFHDAFVRSLGLGLFVAVPAAAGCLALVPFLARFVAVGRMGTDTGVAMVAASLGALSAAVVGQAVFTLCSYAFYAQKDTRAPLLAAVTQVAVCLLGAGLSVLLLEGPALLAGLGAAYSAGTLAGALCMWLLLRRRLASGPVRLLPSLARTCAAAVLMAGPAWLTAHEVASATTGRVGSALAVLAGALVGLLTYAAVSAVLRAPELRWLLGGIGRRGRLGEDLS